jgi:hypothetical protein
MLEIETITGEALKAVTNPWYRAFLRAHNNRRHVNFNPTFCRWLDEMRKTFLVKHLGFTPVKTTSMGEPAQALRGVRNGKTETVYPHANCYGVCGSDFEKWLAAEVKKPGCYRVAELVET